MGGISRVWCIVDWVAGKRQDPWSSDPWLTKLALGAWNMTSPVGKEPELLEEVERFGLPDLNLSGAQLSHVCVNHSLSILTPCLRFCGR